MAEETQVSFEGIDNLSQPAEAAFKAITDLAEAIKKLTNATKPLDKAQKQLKGFSRVGSELKSVGGTIGKSFASVGAAAGGAVLAGLAAMGAATGAVAVGVIGAASDVQGLRKQLVGLSGDTATAEKQTNLLLDVFKATGRPLNDLKQDFLQLKQAGIDDGDAGFILEMATNLQAVTGEGGKLVDAFKDISKDGALTKSTFEKLAEQLGGADAFAASLGKHLGKDQKTIMQMVKSGKGLDFKTVSKSVQELGKNLDGAYLAGLPLTDRLQHMVRSKLLDAADVVNVDGIINAFNVILNSPVIDKIGGVLKDAFLQFVALIYNNGPVIDNILGTIGEAFSAVIDTIGWLVKVTFEFMDAMMQNETIVSAFKMAGLAVVAVLGTLAALFALIPVALFAVAAAVGLVIDSFFRLGFSIVNGLMTAWNTVSSWWSGLDFAALGTAIINGLVNGIKSGASAVLSAVTNLASSVKSSFKSILGIASPSKVFEGFGVNIGEGAELGIDQKAPDVQSAATSMLDTESIGTQAAANIVSPPPSTNNSQGSGDTSNKVVIENITVTPPPGVSDPKAWVSAFMDDLADALERANIAFGN